MRTSTAVALCLASVFLVATSVEARGGGGSSSFFRTQRTAAPTPTPWKYTGCTGDPQPFEDGPWDTNDYSGVRTGGNSSGSDLYCGDLEICFAIDESGSMKAENFQVEIHFVRRLLARLVSKIHVLHPGSYAAWMFDGNSQTIEHQISPLTGDYQSVLNKLNSAGYNGGCTNIAAGLRNCASELSKVNGASKVIVLLSDGGQSVDADGNGVYNMQEEDAHVQLLASDLRNSGITILTLELYQKAAGQVESLTKFLEELASKRSDGTSRFYASNFESLPENEVLLDVMSGSDGVCDDEIVGPTPADVIGDMCMCSKTEDHESGPKKEAPQLRLKEQTGESTGLCTLKMASPTKYVCDLDSNDHVCKLVHGKGWILTLDGEGKSLPPNADGLYECHEVDTVKTILVEN